MDMAQVIWTVRCEQKSFTMTPTGISQFMVRTNTPFPTMFQVSLDSQNSNYCSCGKYKLNQRPCIHMIFVCKRVEERNIEDYLGVTWKRHLFLMASMPSIPDYPVTTIHELEPDGLQAPIISKKRGRPKKSRIESQQATLQVDATTRPLRKCSICKIPGHDRRSCPTRDRN